MYGDAVIPVFDFCGSRGVFVRVKMCPCSLKTGYIALTQHSRMSTDGFFHFQFIFLLVCANLMLYKYHCVLLGAALALAVCITGGATNFPTRRNPPISSWVAEWNHWSVVINPPARCDLHRSLGEQRESPSFVSKGAVLPVLLLAC